MPPSLPLKAPFPPPQMNIFPFLSLLQKHPFILMYEERTVDVACYVCKILDQMPATPSSPMYVDWYCCYIQTLVQVLREKQDVQNLHPILPCFNARPDTMCNNVGVFLPFCLYIIVTYKVHPLIPDHTVLVLVKERRHFALFVDIFMKCGNK